MRGPLRTTLLFVPLLAGCSLLGLDTVPVQRCLGDDDCLAFNSLEDLPESCRAFHCVDGACLRHGEGVEVCDGFDNDCDGLIDEPGLDDAGGMTQTIAPEPSSLVSAGQDGVDRAVYSGDDAGGTSLAWTSLATDNEAAFYAYLPPDQADTIGGEGMSYRRDGDISSLTSTTLTNASQGSECIWMTGDGPASWSCDYGEVALGLGEKVFVAAVNVNGCAAGQLRLGYFDRDGEAPATILRGPARRSNSYLGVDLTDDWACTGGSREGCTGVGSPGCGVARPAMDVIDAPTHSQALVAWIGDGQARDECGGDEAPVEMIAAFLQEGHYEVDFEWVTASNEAVPETLGNTRGGGPPAVVAWGDRGYFVAYGASGGGVSLHFVPTPAEPPAYDGFSCEAADCTGPDDRTGLETGPIAGVIDFPSLDVEAGGMVNDVALSLGAVLPEGMVLGIAWREGCGGDGESIKFRRLVVATEGLLPSGSATVGPLASLDTSPEEGARLGAPTIAYAAAGFVVPGFSRDGSPAAADSTSGGWYVAWSELPPAAPPAPARGHVVARRILDLDGLPLDESERILLSGPGSEGDGDSRAPGLLATDEGVRFIYHDADASLFEGGHLGCLPPDRPTR